MFVVFTKVHLEKKYNLAPVEVLPQLVNQNS